MTDPITKETFQKMYSRWLDVMCIKKENGVEIWPPISGNHRRIRQFLNDNKLKSSLEKKHNCRFIEIDLEEQDNPKLEEFEKIILTRINKRLCIFLLGLDSSLRKSSNILKSLATIIEKNTNISLILFTEVDIAGYDYLTQLMPKSVIFQNIYYQPLFDDKDSSKFLHYLEEKWNFKIGEEKVEELIDKIGGQFLLLKEAARQIKRNSTVSLSKIMVSPVLMLKGIAIFNLLEKKNREPIIRLLKGYTGFNVSDYLINTGFINENKIMLRYWLNIKKELIDSVPEDIKAKHQLNLDLLLTEKEREIFETMLDSDSIVTRDKIAEIIWGMDKEDRYSDWAIDQTIHRIRQKIKKAKLPFSLQTKKGIGFILLEK